MCPCVNLCLFLCVSVGLYLSLSVYACSCLFLSLAVSFLHFLSVVHLLRIQHIISIFSFLFITWIMINTSSTYNTSFMYSLHSLSNNTRATCSSALSGHPSSSFVIVWHILSTPDDVSSYMQEAWWVRVRTICCSAESCDSWKLDESIEGVILEFDQLFHSVHWNSSYLDDLGCVDGFLLFVLSCDSTGTRSLTGACLTTSQAW